MTRPVYGSPDGFGLYGVLGRDDDGRVVCHECGRACEQLATHLRYSHDMSAVEYREAHGLSTGTRLMGLSTLAKLSDSWHRHEAAHPTPRRTSQRRCATSWAGPRSPCRPRPQT